LKLCDEIPYKFNLKGEKLILAHSFSSWSIASFAFIPNMRQIIRAAGPHVREK
jgi:hypothetical protein